MFQEEKWKRKDRKKKKLLVSLKGHVQISMTFMLLKNVKSDPLLLAAE
ncbi:MAG: hypothetical protein JO297_04940 [Nitrososphaeraceae archaeon]|nr:hypothetical protein [Nitrososphaeraceae archaeon]